MLSLSIGLTVSLYNVLLDPEKLQKIDKMVIQIKTMQENFIIVILVWCLSFIYLVSEWKYDILHWPNSLSKKRSRAYPSASFK